MATEITAYLSEDGQLHRSKDDADFSDYMGAVTFSIGAFVDELDQAQAPSFTEVLTKWELWRIGGRDGWAAQRQGQGPSTVPTPPIEQSVVEPAEQVPVKARIKEVKLPPPKERTAIMEALDAARVVSERKLAEARPGAKQEKAYRKHVGVVGLFNIHHASIEREFGEALKLTLYDADCMPRLHGLRGCHKVVVMTKFISHKHIESLKSIGQEPMLVTGGMDKLKEALTTIYVNS